MKTDLTRRAKKLLARGGPVGAISRLSAVSNRSGAVFDIGVNKGTIARHLIRIFPDFPTYLVEPLPEQSKQLADRFRDFPNVSIVNEAFSDTPGQAEFFVGEAAGTSSLLAPLRSEDAKHHSGNMVKQEITVNVNTVDRFCEANDIEHISCMKIDAQGSENKIFGGAQRMLSEQRIDIIMFEWFARPHYEDCPLLLDLWKSLAEHKYSVFDIFPGKRFKNGQLRFGDAVFISESFRNERLIHL